MKIKDVKTFEDFKKYAQSLNIHPLDPYEIQSGWENFKQKYPENFEKKIERTPEKVTEKEPEKAPEKNPRRRGRPKKSSQKES